MATRPHHLRRRDTRLGLTKGKIDMRQIVSDTVGACVVMDEPHWLISKVGETPSDDVIKDICAWASLSQAEFSLLDTSPTSSSSSSQVETSSTSRQSTAGHSGMPNIKSKWCANIRKFVDTADADKCVGVLSVRVRGCTLLWFRDTYEHSIRWAGDPGEAAAKKFTPRGSFEEFIVSYKSTSRYCSGLCARILPSTRMCV
jgi:hypothetical protein